MATAYALNDNANPSGVDPLDLRVVVRPDPSEQVTKGGIILPDQERDKQKFAATKGTLIAKGDNAFSEIGGRPAPGARVMFGKYAGTTFKGADGADYILMNDEDVLALLIGETA